jgi:hypothetical protein
LAISKAGYHISSFSGVNRFLLFFRKLSVVD